MRLAASGRAFGAVLLLAALVACNGVTGGKATAFTFDGEELELREDFRDWTLVGAGHVSREQNKALDPSLLGIRTVHVGRGLEGLTAAASAGEGAVVADGTILARAFYGASDDKELRENGWGVFAKELKRLQVAVKDSSAFPESGWGYFEFPVENGTPARRAPLATGCIQCHGDAAATDHVFTQYYSLPGSGSKG